MKKTKSNKNKIPAKKKHQKNQKITSSKKSSRLTIILVIFISMVLLFTISYTVFDMKIDFRNDVPSDSSGTTIFVGDIPIRYFEELIFQECVNDYYFQGTNIEFEDSFLDINMMTKQNHIDGQETVTSISSCIEEFLENHYVKNIEYKISLIKNISGQTEEFQVG